VHKKSRRTHSNEGVAARSDLEVKDFCFVTVGQQGNNTGTARECPVAVVAGWVTVVQANPAVVGCEVVVVVMAGKEGLDVLGLQQGVEQPRVGDG